MTRLFLFLLSFSLISSSAKAGIDEAINNVTAPIAVAVGQIVFFKIPVFGAQLPAVVLWLIIGAVFFTIYMRFVNLSGFKHAPSLRGGGGNDTITFIAGNAYGGEGNDTITVTPSGTSRGSSLHGGTGVDRFDFSLITSFDDLSLNVIKDFKRGVDTIFLPRLFTEAGVTIDETSTTKNGVLGLLVTVNYEVDQDVNSTEFLFLDGIEDLSNSDIGSPYANLFDL